MPSFDSTFWSSNGRTLRKPDLICLRQDHNLYKTLLMQLVGKIEYDIDGIRLSDKALATSKFSLFIEKAIQENVDLAIAPEYSCPWTSIESFITENALPSENKIWIIGCQSIKSRDLLELISRKQDITWIYDENLVNQHINHNRFFDPVCIFLKTRNANNEVEDIVIIQFKTCNSAEVWERDNFISGDRIYIIDNEINSTRLVTLICSDTLQQLDFNAINQGYFLGQPLLLIHIQLNQKPFDTAYKNYRNNIYMYGNKDDYNKEIICLNWARGVSFEDENGEEVIFNKYGGSSLYCQTSKIDLSDDRINENHRKGLYYTTWKSMKSNVYFLNYNEHLFLIENTKPSQQVSPAVLRNRTGPKIIQVYNWNNSWEEIVMVTDGFSSVCSQLENIPGGLACLTGNNNFTEVERIIQLSSGDIDGSTNESWSKIINLLSFQIGDTEINNRNTFTQDPDTDADSKRRGRIRKYNFLKNDILTDPQEVPTAFSNAILKFDLTHNSKNIYLLNVHSPVTGRKGTAIYLGDKTFAEAKAFKNKIEHLFKDDQQGKQIMIWYNNPHLTKLFDEEIKPEINENVSKSPVSFKKTN